MSIDTSVFHIYGLIITKDVSDAVLQHIKSNEPAMYKEFVEDPTFDFFQEYVMEKCGGLRYGIAENTVVHRIKDGEELDLELGEEFYIIELKEIPTLFSKAYSSYDEIVLEMQGLCEGLFPQDFRFDDYLVEILGEVWG